MHQVTEGVESTWYYHLSDEDYTRGLCGARTMLCGLSLEQWGTVGHLHERYCGECAKLAALRKSGGDATNGGEDE